MSHLANSLILLASKFQWEYVPIYITSKYEGDTRDPQCQGAPDSFFFFLTIATLSHPSSYLYTLLLASP